ncbi:MAG: AMP-binding protein [Alphaproteobacteria bacterium]|nr:AMP-binding protein [Alphaproteobacteria bacterium]
MPAPAAPTAPGQSAAPPGALPTGMAVADPKAGVKALVLALAAHGEHPAIVSVQGDRTETLSYAELGQEAVALAGALAARGIGPGVPVVLFGPNSADWITVRLALFAAGALSIAFDDVLTDAEIATLMPDSGAAIAFTAAAHAPRLRALPDGAALTLFTLDPPAPGSAETHWRALLDAPQAALPAFDAGAEALLVYTSGTTGRPKGFTLTHANLLHNVRSLASQGLVDATDRVLLPLPLHHVYPLTVGLLTTLAIGATLVLPEAVTGPQLVAALKGGRCTVMLGVPRLYAALATGIAGRVAARGGLARRLFGAMLGASILLRRRFGLRLGRRLFGSVHRNLAPDLRLLASGGAKFEAELIWTLEGLGWEVLSGYGLAETASILTNNRHGKVRIGSEGTALPGIALRIAEPDGQGVGEIQCSGPSLFTGYRNNAEATAAAFTADGWFRTGDLGFIDAEGFVFVVGRMKEMIVLGGGKNVFPEELEKIYGASPFIAEMALLERKGALVALVLPRSERIAAEAAGTRQEDVIRIALSEAAQTLPSYQRIAGFALVREPLPKTRLGKVQRFRLPALYEDALAGRSALADRPLSAADAALLETEPARTLWAWLAEKFPAKRLHPDLSPALDLGIDSLAWVSMTLELAERHDIHFTEEDGAEIATLRDLLLLGAKRIGGTGDAQRSTEIVGDPGPEFARWVAPPGLAYRLAGYALGALNAVLMRLFFRLRVSGREHLPAEGAMILAANHLSDLDPPVLAAALDWHTLRRLRWAGDRGRLFSGPVRRAFARAVNIFPVDERATAATLGAAASFLRQGQAVGWFPESWRSPDGSLQEFRPGIGELVRATRATIVPVRISGTFEAMPRTARWPRPHRVTVAFGPPLPAEALLAGAPGAAGTGSTMADAATIAARIREAVAALPEWTGFAARQD